MEAPHPRYHKVLDSINECGAKFEQFLIYLIGEPAVNLMKPFRILLLRIFSVCLYYIVGVIYYNNVEHWSIVDCIYFITVSVSTVGYGQFHATTDGSRVFTAFYIIVGLAFVLTAVDEFARHFIVEFQRTVVRSLYPQSTKLDQAIKMTVSSSVTLLVIMLIGIIFFVNNESWNSAESFYFTITTMTTVGYGDLIINKVSTRIFIIFFICVCLTNYATVIQNFREVQIVTILIRAEKGGAEFMHISDEAVRGNGSTAAALASRGTTEADELHYSQVEMRRMSEDPSEDETFNPFVKKNGGNEGVRGRKGNNRGDVDMKENVDVAVCLMQLLLNGSDGNTSGSSSAQDVQRNSILLMKDLAALKEKYGKSGDKAVLKCNMTKQDIIHHITNYDVGTFSTLNIRKGGKQAAVVDAEEYKSEV